MAKRNRFRRQGEAWNREEVRTLKTLFRNNSNAEVAEVLDRTPKSIERKASKLGLTKTKRYLRELRKS